MKTMASQFQLIAAALFLVLANKVIPQTDSTTFSFKSFSESSSNLTFQGDAHVPSGTSRVRFVRLITTSPVDPAQNSTGRVLYTPPVTFWEPGRQASFETSITFTPWLYSSSITNARGDGVTFFIVPVNSPIPEGSHGGNFGIFNPRTGLAPSVFAFEYDYYYSGEDAAWDPNYWHIGIDINSRVSRNTTRFTSLGNEVTATINYDSSTRTITVLATQPGQVLSLSYVFDLKTILPRQVQVGISGSTGAGVSVPELKSWSFTSALVWDSTNGVEDKAENEEEYTKQYV